jgi:ceramide glucosyltransferase
MTSFSHFSLILCIAALLLHAVTVLLAWRRCRISDDYVFADPGMPAVSLIRPVHGLDTIDQETLRTTFDLDYPAYEIIFCAEREEDPAVPFVRALMARYPDRPAFLLIGTTQTTPNPKLDNIAKGWRQARHDWVVMADSNVLMPPDYLQRLLLSWRADTGVLCSPPIGSHPGNFWAEVECAFLNTYQARWQYAAASVGYGFAQGKTMLWRRADLERRGGMSALAVEVAEDAAATKLVRAAGLRADLVDRPFQQPLGRRRLSAVWSRQLRWAQLRRRSFPAQYVPEIATTSLLPVGAAIAARAESTTEAALIAGLVLAFWFGCEALLARASGWHLSWRSPVTWLLRDLLLMAVWTTAWFRKGYDWRGSSIHVSEPARRPVGATAN